MNHEAAARVVIDMPKDQVWGRLKDLSSPHHYVPGLTGCTFNSDKHSGVGASRRVMQAGNRWMDETVSEWNEGAGFVLHLHRGESGPPAPFARASFRYRIEDAGHHRTVLTTSLMFDLRWGWLGRFLYDRLLSKIFRKTIRDVALSLKYYYESGQPVSPGQLREIRSIASQEV